MVKRHRILIHFRNHLSHSYRLQLLVYFTIFFMVVLSYILIFWHFYPIYEGQKISFTKSAMFVMETITTVGYGELGPFQSDQMAIVAIVIMVTGIVAFFGMINILITPMIQSRIQPIPPKKLSFYPQEHIVIFGYSLVIQELIDNLKIIGSTLVLIEADQNRALTLAARLSPDVQVLWGDYHDEEIWKAAEVQNASYIILFLEERLAARVTLGIKSLSQAEIIAVISDNSREKYLTICGAHQVISTKDILGAITALHALLNVDPEILEDNEIMQDVLKKTSTALGSCQVARIPIIRRSRAIGKTLGELQLSSHYQFRVIAVIDKGNTQYFPADAYVIQASTVLILIGNNANLFRMVMDHFITPHKKQMNAIIAGFGDMGMMIRRDLSKLGITSQTIDADHRSNPSVVGNAEREEVLLEAGISDTQFLLVVTNDDDINLFTTLMARELNPDVTIFSRANDPASVKWMYQAGADYVINVPTIIAQALGRLILYDSSQILLNLRGEYLLIVRYYSINNKEVCHSCDVNAKSSATIVAIDHHGTITFPGDEDFLIYPGDAVYAFGTPSQISQFINIV